jgi:hypothetical protein
MIFSKTLRTCCLCLILLIAAIHHCPSVWGQEIQHVIPVAEPFPVTRHPAPHVQLMVVLQGILEAGASDGEIRTFHPGDALLVEDTVGTGHTSRVTGEERCYMLVIPMRKHK